MIWEILTDKAETFENESFRKTVDDIVNYSVDNYETINIDSIYVTFKNENKKEVCNNNNKMEKLQQFIDEEIKQGFEDIQENRRHEADLRADYYSSIAVDC